MYYVQKPIVLFSFLVLVCFGCKKKDSKEPSVPVNDPLEIVTGIPSYITYNTAELSSIISSVGSESVLDMGICWDNSPEPSINKNKISGGADAKNFTTTLTDLKNDRYYYVRAYATTISGTVYGKEYHFALPRTWIAIDKVLPGKINSMATFGFDIFVGTEDNGVSMYNFGSGEWAPENLDEKNIRSLISDYDLGGTPCLYAATANGIFCRLNGVWTAHNQGLDNLNTTTVLKSSYGLFTLASGNIYRFFIVGGWTKINYSGLVSKMWETTNGVIAYDKASNKIFHIDIDGNIAAPLPSPSTNILTVSEFNGKLYLGADDGGFISSDNGVSWTKVEDIHIAGHPVFSFSEDQYGVCAAVGNDVYRVRPSGNWPRLCPGILQNNSKVKNLCFRGPLFAYASDETSSKLYYLN